MAARTRLRRSCLLTAAFAVGILGTDMVGTSPFSEPQTSRIPTVIVPMIITTHTVAVSFDPKTGILGTTPGDVTQNSGAPQSTCLTPPNNVPSTLVLQSPIFQNAPFNLGGISFGNTQYIDAFQRANFFQALGGDTSRYHVLFDPVRITQPVTLDVPANEGLAIPAQAFGLCGTVQILDFNWFDGFINGTLLPQLASSRSESTVGTRITVPSGLTPVRSAARI